MAAVSSFDVTSTVDLQEVDNAVNQARKEIAQRYDFKGQKAEIDYDRKAQKLTLAASDEDLACLRGRPELAPFLAPIEPTPSRSET